MKLYAIFLKRGKARQMPHSISTTAYIFPIYVIIKIFGLLKYTVELNTYANVPKLKTKSKSNFTIFEEVKTIKALILIFELI